MIIANSSPLIALGRIDRLDIFEALFGEVHIPKDVYQETVIETTVEEQKESILKAIKSKIIIVAEPLGNYPFTRKLHSGEKAVLNLVIDNKARGIIIDDRRARREATEIGMKFSLFYTADILKGAAYRGLIKSYSDVMEQLRSMEIYLPE